MKNVVSEKFLIICSDRTDLAEMRKNLKTVHIQSNCIETSWRNDGRISMSFRILMSHNHDSFSLTELHKFVYARKIVYFCIHRMLMSPAPPDDLSRVSYYFIYKFGNSADLPAIDNTCIAMFNRILLNKKPVRIICFTWLQCARGFCDTECLVCLFYRINGIWSHRIGRQLHFFIISMTKHARWNCPNISLATKVSYIVVASGHMCQPPIYLWPLESICEFDAKNQQKKNNKKKCHVF